MEQAVAEIRSMAGTLQTGSAPRAEWDDRFARAWIELLGEAGAAISAAEGPDLGDVRHRLALLGRELSNDESWSPVWPVFGALIVNLRNILDTMVDVADARPGD